MRSTPWVVTLTVAVTALLVVIIGIAYMYSGHYNVAASAPHNSFEKWVLQTTQKNSVQAHAKKIEMPPEFTSHQLRDGIEHYDSMCVVCHGAPGVERGELGKGITPTPPDLSKAVREWSDRELFWIVKHGIKYAGMPAFGATHSDEELWSIVTFLKQLPETSPAQYQQLAGGKTRYGHGHGSASAGGEEKSGGVEEKGAPRGHSHRHGK